MLLNPGGIIGFIWGGLFGWIDVASLFSFLLLPLEVGYSHISFIHEGGELFEEIREIVVCFFFKKCWSALTPFIWAIYNDISRRLVTPNGGLVREASPKIGKPFATQLAKGHPLSNCRGVAHEQREKAWLFRLRIYNKLPRFKSFDSAPWNCVYGMPGATSCQGKCWPCGRLWSKGAIKGGQLIPSGSGFFGEEKSEVFLFEIDLNSMVSHFFFGWGVDFWQGLQFPPLWNSSSPIL